VEGGAAVPSSSYAIGVDFGTSTSLVAEKEGYDLVDVLPLGRGGLEKWFPSVAALHDGQLIVGEDADQPQHEPVIRSIKRAITEGKQTVQAGPHQVLTDDVVRAILREIADRSKEAGLPLETDDTLRLGCPAMWDGGQRQRLLSLADAAGIPVTDRSLIDEPVAAGVAWLTYRYLRFSESVQGRLLVFDMGGGTLDVAVLDVVGGPRPEVSVLSSLGIAKAGDDLDNAVTDDLIHELRAQGCDVERLPSQAMSELRRAARAAKVALSTTLDRTIALNPALFGEARRIRYTRERLEEAFRPQMDTAVELVWAALRSARLTEQFAPSPMELRQMGRDVLREEVAHILLAGGMSRIPYVERRLGEEFPGVPIYTDVGVPPDEAIVAGLADTIGYDRINLHRPGFDFVLEWDGQRRVLYQAHTPLYEPWQIQLGRSFLGHEWRSKPNELPTTGHGVLLVRSTDGTPVKLDLGGRTMDGLQVPFGSHEVEFKIYCDGELYLRDGRGRRYSMRVDRWPVIRGRDYAAKLLLQRLDELPDPPVPWYLRDDD